MDELSSLFYELTKQYPDSVVELSASGSNRKYYRLQSNAVSLIGVVGTSLEENKAFFALSRHFGLNNIPVPEVLAVSNNGLNYLQTDLGDTLLFDYISEGRKTGGFNDDEKLMLRKTIEKLPEIQIHGADGFDFSVCYPQPELNKRSVLWDLNYFKYYFLKPSGTEFQENLLEDDFEEFATQLLQADRNSFMYRDFQTRNVMIFGGEPYFIDFQGGRKGPLAYDVASFLWQAKAGFSAEMREDLLKVYLNSLQRLRPVNEVEFRQQLQLFVLFRMLQVLGAYGYRGYFEKKAHFLQSIPFAIANLKEILDSGDFQFPYLKQILHEMVTLQQPDHHEARKTLQVTVQSFSYRKGIPEDNSGNGGGFVFDCRAIHNPGRYEQYQHLTGLDEPVVKFLEEDGEILTFLEHVFALVDASVQRYKSRGFTDLMINFGCTGGQHRSVYAAQKTAEHLSEKYGVEIILIHREQNITAKWD